MVSSKEGKQKAEEPSRITFDSEYAYRSLDKVRGSIDHDGIETDKIKVHLTGTTVIIQTRFVENSYRVLEKEWEFLKLTQRCTLDTDAGSKTLFSFRLPEALIESVCPLRDPYHLLLPPSIGRRRKDGLDDLSPRDPVNVRIEYRIVAEFFKAGELQTVCKEPFRVAPRHFTSPQTMNPPPGYDETVLVEGDVHRAIGGKIGVFKIRMQQPPALLTSLEEHQLTTGCPLQLEFHSTTNPPPRIQGIGVKLVAETHSRTEHLLEGATDDVRRTTEVRLNKLVLSKNSAPVWFPARPGVYTSSIDVPVTLCPKGYVAVPEFQSCLASRSYSLILKFELHSTNSSIPLVELKLKVPAWVMADEFYGMPCHHSSIRSHTRWQVPKDLAEDNSSLPIYEDAYLTNYAPTRESAPGSGTHTPQMIVGNEGTRTAPFSLLGQEPEYFVNATSRVRSPPAATPASSNSRGRSTSIQGVEPDEQIAAIDEAHRVPAWAAKEQEQASSRSASHARHPNTQDGAQ